MSNNLESSLSNINLDFENIKIEKSYEIPLSGMWSSIKMSGDGKYQIASQLSPNGQIFISSNHGINWIIVQYLTDRKYIGSFADVAISKDGKYMTVIQVKGGIATSEDYGVTWKIIDNFVVKKDTGYDLISLIKEWNAIDISGDGKYQTATTNQGEVYRSEEYGRSWNKIENIIKSTNSLIWIFNSLNLTSISMSYTGKYQTLIFKGGGFRPFFGYEPAVIISTDYGITWTDLYDIKVHTGFIFDYFDLYTCYVNKSTDINIDGKYQYCSSYTDNKIYISKDYGQTWAKKIFIEDSRMIRNNIYSITSSSDGKNIYLSLYSYFYNSNVISISNDYGETWSFLINNNSNIFTSSYQSFNIFKIDTSYDGKYVSITNYNNKILLSNDYLNTLNDLNDSPIFTYIYPVKCSSSGQYQLSFIGNKILTSDNYGKTWNIITYNEIYNFFGEFDGKEYMITENLTSCDISLSGEYQYVINKDGILLSSNDYGKTWDLIAALGAGDIIKTSGDGKYVYIIATINIKDESKLYQFSDDYGIFYSFNNLSESNSLYYMLYNPFRITISLTGEYQFISDSYGIVFSNNYGNTFSSYNNLFGINRGRNINTISVSSNGRYKLLTQNISPFNILTSSYNDDDVYFKTHELRDDIVSINNSCMSSTGQFQFVSLKTNPNIYIYYSIDYGNKWSLLDTSSINYSCDIASVSSTGQYIILSNQNSIYQIYFNYLIK